jgi:hypothetical protein
VENCIFYFSLMFEFHTARVIHVGSASGNVRSTLDFTTRMKKRVKIKALTAPNNIPGASWNAADTGLGAPWNGPRKTRDHALSRLQFVLINKGNDGATSGAEVSSA